MDKLSRIILFILVNLMGFMAMPLCVRIGVASGVLSPDNPAFDPATFKSSFMVGTYLTWLVCALFSVAYFFLKGKERLLFLWAPFVIPMAYGLKALFSMFV